MRLLFARVGHTYCRQCGVDVTRETAELVARRLSELPLEHATPPRLRAAAGGHVRERVGRRCRTWATTTRDDADLPAAPKPSGLEASRQTLESAAAPRLRPRDGGWGRGRHRGRRERLAERPHQHRGRGGSREARPRRAAAASPTRWRPRTARAAGPRSPWCSGTGGEPDRADRVLGEVRVPHLRHRLRDAAAAAVLLQQPVRRLRDVQRLRQHHRARHDAGGARPLEVDQPGRHRAVDQAALPQPPRRAEARGEEVGAAARRARGRSSPTRSAPGRGRRRRLRRRARLLPLARAEEVQGARSGLPQPLPRLPGVPRLRRRAAAARGARRAGGRADDRCRVGADGAPGAGLLRAARSSRRRKRRWPTRCCAKSGGASRS